MKYKYNNPIDRGYRKIKLTKQQHEKLFGKKSKITKYEYYTNDSICIIHKFQPFYITLINIMMFPFFVVWFGIQGIPEIMEGILKLIFQKKTGNFVSNFVSLNDEDRKDFQETLNLIR